jgi:hypothetical protein
MLVIDEKGSVTADSITKKRRHHVFRSGEGLAPKLLFHNWVTGCTMLVPAKLAKAAVPFCPYMVHDHWLALFCANQGRIRCLADPLITYRIHSGNQTLEMAGVRDRESYISIRIELVIKRIKWLIDNFRCNNEMKAVLADALLWAQAREANIRRRGGKYLVWKYRHFSWFASIFEIFAPAIPESLFMRFIDLKRKNRI